MAGEISSMRYATSIAAIDGAIRKSCAIACIIRCDILQ